MRIGELARRTATTPKAIRLYEARGLLGPVARTGSYRHYAEAQVARVQLIRRAQALGFGLAELAGLPALDSATGWEDVGQRIAARRVALAAERARLATLDAALAELEAELRGCDSLRLPASAQACSASVPAAPQATGVARPRHRFVAQV